jgi:hypothetical protein
MGIIQDGAAIDPVAHSQIGLLVLEVFLLAMSFLIASIAKTAKHSVAKMTSTPV